MSCVVCSYVKGLFFLWQGFFSETETEYLDTKAVPNVTTYNHPTLLKKLCSEYGITWELGRKLRLFQNYPSRKLRTFQKHTSPKIIYVVTSR